MKDIAVEYLSISIAPGKNGKKLYFQSYISDYNEQDTCDPHAHMFYLLKHYLNQEYY